MHITSKTRSTLEILLVQGTWMEEQKLLINIGQFSWLSYTSLSTFMGFPIRMLSDNATAMAYINRQQQTRSHAVQKEVNLPISWADMFWSSDIHIPEGVCRVLSLVGGTGCGTLGTQIQQQTGEVTSDPQAFAVNFLGTPWDQFSLINAFFTFSFFLACCIWGRWRTFQ